MDLPKGKNRPKLPPKPRGGGAAARQDQFDRERGLKDGARLPDTDREADEPEETREDEDQSS